LDYILLKNIVEYAVFGILIFMSFISVSFAIERFIYYTNLDIKSIDNKKRLEILLGKRLSTIATIGSNAPYVGLLGTVLGIMMTFLSIGESGIENTKSLMEGLALALQATALGLVVAIPSIIFYNYLAAKAEVLLNLWDIHFEDR
jgi:biopolymer transport protein ExbB